MARLSAPLEKGQMYQAGFQANLSNLATYATDDIGMAFFYDRASSKSQRHFRLTAKAGHKLAWLTEPSTPKMELI